LITYILSVYVVLAYPSDKTILAETKLPLSEYGGEIVNVEQPESTAQDKVEVQVMGLFSGSEEAGRIRV
jgi:hypothetical protein